MLRLASAFPLRSESCLPLADSIRSLPQTICMMSKNPSAWKPTFVPMEGLKGGGPSKELAVIRVVSYNILAQVYVKSCFFPHSPSPCLRWKARSQAILDRLSSLEADILCLQELDEFESFYKGQLDRHGYSSVYVKRTGKKRDGCGIFFRRERLELVSDEPIYYNDLVPHVDEVDEEALASENAASSDEENVSGKDAVKSEDRGDPNDPRVRLKRDCVGIMSAFRVSDAPDKLIVVVNTHLYWDPDWADVKLAQAKYLVSRALEFQSKLAKRFHYRSPVIICGDFNSTPGDEVYTYLTSGGCSNENLLSDPLTEVQSLVEKEAMTSSPFSGHFCQGTLKGKVVESCPLPLYSLYALLGGEPTFTNCTPDFTGTLDYIFFSSLDDLKPLSLLELSSPTSLDVLGGLPNYSHPSDHLPIGTDFAMIN